MDTISDGVNPAFQAENGSAVFAVPDGRNAITVRHGYIQYIDVLKALASGSTPTTNVILKDFNITVQKGHIYGLLGASGCGKTSLLRAIVGQLDLTAGEIRVLGHKPKTPESGIPGTTVGYMPQELSLLEDFTIKETLYFYGQLGGMNAEEISNQCDYFVKLLDLPKTTRIVSTLSGGQQRRVSFAIALMHSPPVLILDEPTVGVDPLLRESIWDYLTKLVKTNGTTVLITTHYIEEATRADTVGLMRDGKLMAEQNPRSLIQSLQCNNLEDVLLKLCLLQSSKTDSISTIDDMPDLSMLVTVNEEDTSTENMTPWTTKRVSPMQRLRVLAWKDSITLVRHYWYASMITFFPILILYLLCLSVGRPPTGLKVSVFNQEANCFKSGIIAKSFHTGENNTINCALPHLLSCSILKFLQEMGISALVSESEASAEKDVRDGLSWAAVTFQRNFTSALIERAGYSSPFDVNENVIDMGTIRIALDQSDRIVSFLLQDQLIASLKNVLNDVNDACHNLRHMKDLPIQYKPPIYGGSVTTFRDFVAPGLVTGLVMMTSLTASLCALLPEKIQGTLERGLVVGVKMSEVVLSQFAVCLVPEFIVIAVVITVPYVVYQLHMIGSFLTMAVLLVPMMIFGILLGFVLALTCNTITSAMLLGMCFYFTCLFTSGTLWPVEGVHPYIRLFCWMLPLTLPTDAVRNVAIRGWSLGNKSIQLSLACTSLWCLAFLAIVLSILRLNR